jgi:hypothetical protein
MSDNIPGAGRNGEFKDEVIVRIWKDGPPPERNRMFDGNAAKVVEYVFDAFRTGPEVTRFAASDFFIFEKQSGGNMQPPPRIADKCEEGKRGAITGAESRDEDVCVQDGIERRHEIETSDVSASVFVV